MLQLNKNASDNKIYTTFFGVGLDFGVELVNIISKTKGCNYYTIEDEKSFKKLLEEDFNYMIYPTSFEIYLNIVKGKFTNIYGSGDTDVNTKGSLAYM